MKKSIILVLIVLIFLSGCSKSESEEKYEDLQLKYNDLHFQFETLKSDYDTLQTQYNEMSSQNEQLQSEQEDKVSFDLGETLLSGWAIGIFGNADCSRVGNTFQIVSTISDTSNTYIKTYNDRFTDGLSDLATMYTADITGGALDCDAIFIKVISKDIQPIIEYVVYPDGNSSDFMINTQFLSVLDDLVD